MRGPAVLAEVGWAGERPGAEFAAVSLRGGMGDSCTGGHLDDRQ